MSARGTAFLQLWLERNVLSLDRDQASRRGEKLVSDAKAEGLSLEVLKISPCEEEGYIRDVIVHVGKPVTPGD